MPATRTKRQVVKELTPENPQDAVRRSSRRTLAPKRLEYSPEAELTETPQKKKKIKSHDKTNQKYSEAPSLETSEDQSNGALSTYELERLENIRKNQEFLSSLNIFQVTDELKLSVRPKASQRGLKRSQTVQSEVLPPRRSMRLQNMEAEVLQLPPESAINIDRDSTPPGKPSGPLQMEPVNTSDGKVPEQLLEFLAESSSVENLNKRMDLKGYLSSLSNMKITEDRVAKVVKDRIFSVAFHPSSSSVLMAAGDKWGRVGLWNLSGAWGDDGVLLFEPHSRPVTCMAFSPASSDFLSASYDGSMRCIDVEKAVFDEVYVVEDGLKTFDFLSDDGMSLLVGSWYGDIAIVDRRTPGNSHESLHTLQTKTVRCVSVHPMEKRYFAVAESQVVNIYDSRYLKKTKSAAVCQLKGHTKSITSAYFSPDSGNRILTSCLDDRIRIYDTSVSTDAPLLKTISHNMKTGRWLTKLSAVWDPKQEDCFAVGSLSRQRCVEVYHESGRLLHTFVDENLTTVQSVVAFHPSRPILMGGNASGRLHVFA